tara:strand:+ start:6242 stop:6442 length:201 start_codon:yes stop_codon:yes gene_type:complete
MGILVLPSVDTSTTIDVFKNGLIKEGANVAPCVIQVNGSRKFVHDVEIVAGVFGFDILHLDKNTIK